MVTEAITTLWHWLIPTTNHSPQAQFWWRVRVAGVVCTTFMGLVGVTMAAFGAMPGFEGFAKAGDLQSVVIEIRRNRAANLDGLILELRIKHCKGASDEARQLYWSKISPLMVEYRILTGQAYVLPACADL